MAEKKKPWGDQGGYEEMKAQGAKPLGTGGLLDNLKKSVGLGDSMGEALKRRAASR